MKLVFILALLATSAFAADAPPKIDPEKSVTVTLPVQDWQAVLESLQDSARVSAHDANRINRMMVGQIQQQLAPARTSGVHQ